jgi:hypothetical protein
MNPNQEKGKISSEEQTIINHKRSSLQQNNRKRKWKKKTLEKGWRVEEDTNLEKR